MLIKNINNKIPFEHNQISQKKKMQIHKKMFLTLAASLLFSVNYGNSCFADKITKDQAKAFKDIIDKQNGKVSLEDITQSNDVPQILKDSIKKFADVEDNKINQIASDKDRAFRVVRMLIPIIVDQKGKDVFDGLDDNEAARILVDSLLKMYNQDNTKPFNDLAQSIKGILQKTDGQDYDNPNANANDTTKDAISAILRDTYCLAKFQDEYTPTSADLKKYGFKEISKSITDDYIVLQKAQGEKTALDKEKGDLTKAKDDLTKEKDDLTKEKQKLTDNIKNLEDEIDKLKAKDPEKLDPKIQDEIKKKDAEIKQDNDKKQQIIDKEKIIDKENRPEVIKVQEKLQIVQAPIEAQVYTVQNIATIQSSIVSNITNSRMNINQFDIRTSEDENKPVAAGSQTIGTYITPKSWDIWANGHMGNIKQDAANATSTNSKTDFYGGSIGIDKIFANNSIWGLALSYGKSNTEYTSKTSTGAVANEKWASNYYQADIYAQHNFTNNLFLQLIGGIGTYGDGTTIGNMFDFSSQEFTFGYHGNATIGYSIFGGEDSNFAITPKLSAVYYHLNIPDSIIGTPNSSTFTTLDRVDGIAGLNIKIFNLNNNVNSNIQIIPEITAAVKFRFYDNVDGINANNIKVPVATSINPNNNVSANVLATPEQLFTLGGALTVTNNNFSISLHGSLDFAEQYLAAIGSISVKLSF